jgi:hypothetical protein
MKLLELGVFSKFYHTKSGGELNSEWIWPNSLNGTFIRNGPFDCKFNDKEFYFYKINIENDIIKLGQSQ